MTCNCKKGVSLLFFIFLCVTSVFSKHDFKDNNGGDGHADDLSKLLTGKNYYSHSGNQRLFTVLTGLTLLFTAHFRLLKNLVQRQGLAGAELV
ncbi:hypothetical protein FACS1894190_17940 [Spirochaetia bacterium]|nr:hypothetical protein FACS1894190_17940 [Spirochaetia bacterium]